MESGSDKDYNRISSYGLASSLSSNNQFTVVNSDELDFL